MTPIGENSKIVITGDLEQCDRKDIKQTNKMWGLEYACAKLKDLDEFGSVEFGIEDIVRNPIITKIITKWKEWFPFNKINIKINKWMSRSQ